MLLYQLLISYLQAFNGNQPLHARERGLSPAPVVPDDRLLDLGQ
jgi:hypothetical protein